jgi:4-carboxymuconolactone decarboxylase
VTQVTSPAESKWRLHGVRANYSTEETVKKIFVGLVVCVAMNCAFAQERMPRIPEDRMTEAQKQAVAEIIAGPRGAFIGPFVSIVRSPGFMRPVQKVGEYVRYGTKLDRRISELAALIASRQWTQQYEWHGHYPQAIKAGLKVTIIDAIAEGRRPTGMAEDEEIVYDFLTELFANKGVSDATYARTLAKFGEEQLMDICGNVGYYTMIGMIMNVARTAVPEGPPPLLVPLPR